LKKTEIFNLHSNRRQTEGSKLRKRIVAGLFSLFLVLGLVCSCSAQTETNTASISDKAVSFVLSNFNSTIGLCSEVPEGTPNSQGFTGDVFWITSDNLLAYALLKQYNTSVANTILQTMKAYANNHTDLPKDSQGIPISLKHEPILGDSFPDGFQPRGYVYCDLTVTDSYEVKIEVNNGSIWGDWQTYSDELAWVGLSYLNKGNYSQAQYYYNQTMSMWNGVGFNDARYSLLGYYETFKLGLAIYLRKALNLTKPPAETEMEQIIERCQQDDGGICVNYNDSLDTWGNPNTETTALIGLANMVIIPEFPSFFILPLFMIATLLAVIVYRKKRTQISRTF
jgi:hypothetical protein